MIYKYQSTDLYGRYIWAEKSFKTQKELFKYLVEEKDLILSQKKSIIKRTEGGISLTLPSERISTVENKGLKTLYQNDKEHGVLKRTIVANTYWWMDNHSDVHLSGTFSDSIKGRESKVFPIDQHNYSLDGRMGKTLALYESQISWKSLGVARPGMTEALFADAQIEKERNERRYKDYLNDEIDQHSVGMRYIDIQMGINDEDEYPKEYAVYQKFINRIGNREQVEKQGYFFAVGKASLLEYSAVIAGSNELTPTMGQNAGATGKQESAGATRDKQLLEALKKFETKTKKLL